jgi:lipid II isoglutaminyl synthase (glutamine-hydrolysing)
MTTIHLTHLYAKEMSIYGDRGNLLALSYYLKKIGYSVVVNEINIGDILPKQTDFYFFGGGGDTDQSDVAKDLELKKVRLKKDVANGVPLLAICGGYQLLGESYVDGTGNELNGISLFPVKTVAPDNTVTSRCVGNLVVESLSSKIVGKLVGFENHGGQTVGTNDTFIPLAKTLVGFGNNSKKEFEGCMVHNAIGCYLHGPVLTKNESLVRFIMSTIQHNLQLKQEFISDPDVVTLHDSLIHRFYA